jgi:superoxide dismutase, Cu-Zn family
MISRKLVPASLGLLALLACVGLPPRPTSVKFFDADNRLVGFVDLLEIRNGVRFRVHTIGLPGGARGLNIQEKGVCEPPSFFTSGAVFNPLAGDRDSVVEGDLPDITVGAAEWADTTFDWAHVRLDDGDRGLFRDGGTSLVILETPDGGNTDPNTTSKRLACGVIMERPEER